MVIFPVCTMYVDLVWIPELDEEFILYCNEEENKGMIVSKRILILMWL